MLAVGKASAFACLGGNKNCFAPTRRFDFFIAFNYLGLSGKYRTCRRSKCGFGQTQWVQ